MIKSKLNKYGMPIFSTIGKNYEQPIIFGSRELFGALIGDHQYDFSRSDGMIGGYFSENSNIVQYNHGSKGIIPNNNDIYFAKDNIPEYNSELISYAEALKKVKKGNAFVMTTIQPELLKILGDENLSNIGRKFHDKNEFYYFLKGLKGNKNIKINMPETYPLNLTNNNIIQELAAKEILNQDDIKVIAGLFDDKIIKPNEYNQYYIKQANIGGGFGVSLLSEQERVHEILKIYTKFLQEGNKVGLQLQKRIEINEITKKYFYISPCITIDIADNGFCHNVSDQVLKGATHLGNKYSKNGSDIFYKNTGHLINELCHALQSDGLRGSGGTDFVFGKDNNYHLIIDPNFGRFNGSTPLSYMIRKLTLEGTEVRFASQGKLQFDNQKDLGTTIQKIPKFNHNKGSGVIILPSSPSFLEDGFELRYISINLSKDQEDTIQNIIQQYQMIPKSL